MNWRKNFLKSMLYRGLGIIIISVFAFIVGFFCMEIKSIASAFTLATVYLIVVILYIGAEQHWRYKRVDIIKKSEHMTLIRKGYLLSGASQKVADMLKEITYIYSELKPNYPCLDTFRNGWSYNHKRFILQSICEVLKNDHKNYIGPSDYFKATLFKVSSPDLLELDCNYYPPGAQPKTTRIERSSTPGATAFHCLDLESMRIIPNIPEELEKGADSEWIELWPGQAKQYGSMLCAPISIGERAKGTFRVVSILTIDTNRLNYFSKEKEEYSFWSIFLAPYRTGLSFVYISSSNETLMQRNRNDTKSK